MNKMNEILKRHDLVFFKNPNMLKKIIEEDLLELLGEDIQKIPGIVKRQKENSSIELGVSLPLREDGVRIRRIIKIDEEDIGEIYSPYKVAEKYSLSNKKYDILDSLIELGEKYNFELGIFGSLALKIVTDLSYFEKISDIDLVIKIDERKKLYSFFSDIVDLEKKSQIKLDIEIELKDNFYIKLKEYCDKNTTILLKGLYDMKLGYKKDLNW